VKVTGATSLHELQQLVLSRKLDLHVNYVGSAACYRCVVVGPSALDEMQPLSVTGLGRDLGEALANALQNFDSEILKEKMR
jgi:hypothetical protein